MTELDQDLEQQAANAGAQLREHEVDVPAEVSQRLQAARRLAVAEAERGSQRRPVWPALAGAGATIAAALVVAVVLQTPPHELPKMDGVELAAAQEAELLEELEFVAWMVAMEEGDDLPNSG